MNPPKSMQQKVLTPEQQAILLLWQRVNTSLTAFYKLSQSFKSAQQALHGAGEQWAQLGIHAAHITRHNEATAAQDATFIAAIEQCVEQGQFKLVFKEDAAYPPQLAQLFDPPPLLFYRGNVARLQQVQIAIVGSRSPTQKAQKFTFDMAQYLAAAGYIITSGLAQGVDAQAHLGALAQSTEQSGHTIGVMGTGIDVCYPAQHQPLFDRIVAEGGCIISELLPGTPPHKHTFPRRNRLVAGLSFGTIVTEAAIKSGSLITARLAAEQGKQVFALPSSIDNHHAEGCHHLIREGATLIYHPDQVIAELSSQIVTPALRQSIDDNPLEPDASDATPLARLGAIPDSDSLFASEPSLRTSKDSPAPQHSQQAATQSSIKPFAKSLPKPSTQSTTRPPPPKKKSAPNIVIPKHLQTLWVHLDFEAQDLDALMLKTELATPTLLAQLMELELLSAITQVAGRYKRL